jgi:glycosyltransferase involved in cell wall biosynthesis
VLSEGCHLPEVDGTAGLVVPGGAADAAEALTTLLLDEPRRLELAAGARAFAEDFRREVVMPRMLDFLESIARR